VQRSSAEAYPVFERSCFWCFSWPKPSKKRPVKWYYLATERHGGRTAFVWHGYPCRRQSRHPCLSVVKKSPRPQKHRRALRAGAGTATRLICEICGFYRFGHRRAVSSGKAFTTYNRGAISKGDQGERASSGVLTLKPHSPVGSCGLMSRQTGAFRSDPRPGRQGQFPPEPRPRSKSVIKKPAANATGCKINALR
jgi:hypothetical protein